MNRKDKGRFGHLELEHGPARGKIAQDDPRRFDEAEYIKRADSMYWQGEHEGALRLYSRALGLNPHLEAGWVGQCKCLLALDELKEVGLWAQKGLDYLPRSGELMAVQAVALAREGHRAGAMRLSDRSIEGAGTTPFTWIARAWALGHSGEKNADFCISKAVEQGGHNWQVLAEAAAYYVSRKQFGNAIQMLQKATTSNPDNPMLWFRLGRCYLNMGLRAQAVAALEHACRREPGNQDFDEWLNKAKRQNPFSGILRRLFGKGQA